MNIRTLCLALALAGAGVPALAAPVLLGSAGLDAAADLTVIQDGSTRYEFLDLTPTYGTSVASALAAYGGRGFRWAGATDMQALFGAFGFNYGAVADYWFTPGATPAQTEPLAALLGYQPDGPNAIGWIDDLNNGVFHTYACISRCGPDTFVHNVDFAWPTHRQVGVFLVRSAEEAAPVPEPGTAALAGIGLLLLAGARRLARGRSQGPGCRNL